MYLKIRCIIYFRLFLGSHMQMRSGHRHSCSTFACWGRSLGRSPLCQTACSLGLLSGSRLSLFKDKLSYGWLHAISSSEYFSLECNKYVFFIQVTAQLIFNGGFTHDHPGIPAPPLCLCQRPQLCARSLFLPHTQPRCGFFSKPLVRRLCQPVLSWVSRWLPCIFAASPARSWEA